MGMQFESRLGQMKARPKGRVTLVMIAFRCSDDENYSLDGQCHSRAEDMSIVFLSSSYER